MSVNVRETGPDSLDTYGSIPIRFTVDSVFRVHIVSRGLGGLVLTEEEVQPYIKDCDAIDEEGQRPQQWPERFDVTNWGFFLAEDDGRPVGGATVAFDTPGVNMLEGRQDLAVLWDLRVHPEHRRCGVGTKLFQHAADWARQRGCQQLKIETQNVNVAACRFYAKQGCVLGAIDRHAYAGCPAVAHEAMLLWRLDL